MYMAERGGFPTRLSYESALDFTSHPQFCSCNNHGGERGIRTPDTLRYTRFPSVRTRPLCDLSRNTAGVYGDFIKMQILEYSYVYDFGCYFPAFRYNLSFFIIYETTIDCDLRICSFFYPDHSVSLDRIYHSPSTLYYSSYWVITTTFFATIFLRTHSYFAESESIGRVGNCWRGHCFLSC